MKHRLNLLPLSIPHHDPGYEEETLKYLLGSWHMQNMERGITERSMQLFIDCLVIRDPLHQDKFSESWEWEKNGTIPLLPKTLYVVENFRNRASHLYNCLIRDRLHSSQVLHFCRRKSDIDSRIPCLYMNDENRFRQIADKLLGAGIWTKTGTEITFRPEQILPETETQK